MMETFQVANKYHLMHSIVLIAMPLTRRPMLVCFILLFIYHSEIIRYIFDTSIDLDTQSYLLLMHTGR